MDGPNVNYSCCIAKTLWIVGISKMKPKAISIERRGTNQRSQLL